MKQSIKQSITFFLAFLSFSVAGQANASIGVEVLFMEHGPMRPTISKVRNLMTTYGDAVHTSWYNVNQQSGKDFMKKKKINGHIPMMILIEGQSDFTIQGREVIFQGFPTGASPFKRVEGNWSLDDLKILLDQKTR